MEQEITTRKGVILNIIPEERNGLPQYKIRIGKGLMEEIGEDTTILAGHYSGSRKLKEIDGEIFTSGAIMEILGQLHHLRGED